MSDVTNLNLLEDYILDRSNIRQRGKRPKDVIGDLAERRMLPRDWLIDKFGIGVAHSGYVIPIDDPEVDPEIEIDYEIDGIVREGKKMRGLQLYSWLQANNFPDGYRLLCHNCNAAVRWGRLCPHTRYEN